MTATRTLPIKLGLSALAVLSSAGVAHAQPADSDSPEVIRHIKAAEALAGEDLKTPLFLCRADSGVVVRQNLANGLQTWLAPTRIFDNIYYVGNRFVGVIVVSTSEGLILFDSSTSADEARDHLVPSLIALGLKPQDIRYVIVTHGHWDHFGGAAYLQKTYGARIGLSAADWDLIEKGPPGALEINSRTPPTRDMEIIDGQTLTLGDTAIELYLTPGHTPGTVSAIIPGREGGRTYALSLLGSVAFPPGLEPTDRFGGLRKYDGSVLRFAELSRQAGAVGILNTHSFADGGLARLDAVQHRSAAEPNPFLIGQEAVARYYDILHECLQAAALRPSAASAWTRPLSSPGSSQP